MAPTFYTVNASPPCVVIELLVRKLGLDIERKQVDMLTGEHKKPEYLKVTCQISQLFDLDYLSS